VYTGSHTRDEQFLDVIVPDLQSLETSGWC